MPDYENILPPLRPADPEEVDETYGFGILPEDAAIEIAKNIKIPRDFVLPRSVTKALEDKAIPPLTNTPGPSMTLGDFQSAMNLIANEGQTIPANLVVGQSVLGPLAGQASGTAPNLTGVQTTGLSAGFGILTSPNLTGISGQYQYAYGGGVLGQTTPGVHEDDRKVGCIECKAVREKPVTPEGTYSHEGRSQNREGLGYCGVCGCGLQYVECLCGEPLHQEEKFCRSCGKNNAPAVRVWSLMEDKASPEEIEARGNVEDEGSVFRGVREA